MAVFMWQVLKAVTIIFTICPSLQRKKVVYLFFFLKENPNFFLLCSQGEQNFFSNFFLWDFHKEKKHLLLQIKDISLAVKNHRISLEFVNI